MNPVQMELIALDESGDRRRSQVQVCRPRTALGGCGRVGMGLAWTSLVRVLHLRAGCSPSRQGAGAKLAQKRRIRTMASFN